MSHTWSPTFSSEFSPTAFLHTFTQIFCLLISKGSWAPALQDVGWLCHTSAHHWCHWVAPMGQGGSTDTCSGRERQCWEKDLMVSVKAESPMLGTHIFLVIAAMLSPVLWENPGLRNYNFLSQMWGYVLTLMMSCTLFCGTFNRHKTNKNFKGWFLPDRNTSLCFICDVFF